MLRTTKLHILIGTGGFDTDLITGGIYNFGEKSKRNQSSKQNQKQKKCQWTLVQLITSVFGNGTHLMIELP